MLSKIISINHILLCNPSNALHVYVLRCLILSISLLSVILHACVDLITCLSKLYTCSYVAFSVDWEFRFSARMLLFCA